ncbi:MAG: hypothetical protein IKN55_10255 [Oscillospiraceae bacterium]|nr:hypothetical protein [Oscillospiraceae bacterium]
MFGSDFEEDYIMRQIKNIIHAAVKLVCNIDTTAQFRQEMKTDAFANRLMEAAGSGSINDAENLLYEKSEAHDPETFRAGLAFYDYLNSMDDSFLEAHDFTREEIQDGLQHLATEYGMGELLGLLAQ